MTETKRIKRRMLTMGTSGQLPLVGLGEMVAASPVQVSEPSPIRFNVQDPSRILINQCPLGEHLKQIEHKAPLRIRKLLAALSFGEFEKAYLPGGRPPYAPRDMVGVILYGIMNQLSSLRDLEKLARLDIGCWWISGGIAPDHSVIGRFIQRHQAELTEAFFVQLTAKVLAATGSGVDTVAGDGTIIQAAASNYRLMRREALEAARKEAEEALKSAPDDKQQQAKVARLVEADALLKERETARQQRGRDAKTTLISPKEAEAVVQLQKDKKTFKAAYKPQVLANAKRVIVACAVHPTSETKPLASLLQQAGQQGTIETALFDAGYFCDSVLANTAALGIELLCPEGNSLGEVWEKESSKYFPKNRFNYDQATNSYRCPQGETLKFIRLHKGSAQYPAYRQYGTTACGSCPLKAQCTRSKEGRRIKRYASDDEKDALRQKMRDPEVRVRYGQRKAMVEPVFSYLRGSQGLNRFHRFGLRGVRVEFALHAMAYNLSRLLAYLRLTLLHAEAPQSRAFARMAQLLAHWLALNRYAQKNACLT